MPRGLRWGIWGLGVLAVVGVVLLVVGRSLPEEHVASSSSVYRQPPDTVWTHVRDFSRYADWWPEIASTRLVPGSGRAEVWQLTNRSDPGFPLEVVESHVPSRLVTRIVDDGLPFGGTWTFELVEEEGGVSTRLTITEEGRIYNPFFRVMSRWVFGYHGTQEGYLRALADHFGETARVERWQ